MDIKEIQSLIKFVAKSGATEVKLEMDDFKITIKTGTESGTETTYIQQIPAGAPAILPAVATPAAPDAETPATAENADNDIYITVKSPIICTFYRKPSPDKAPFVEVGSDIKQGDFLCVIEAMK